MATHPVLLPGEFYGRRNLRATSPWAQRTRGCIHGHASSTWTLPPRGWTPLLLLPSLEIRINSEALVAGHSGTRLCRRDWWCLDLVFLGPGCSSQRHSLSTANLKAPAFTLPPNIFSRKSSELSHCHFSSSCEGRNHWKLPYLNFPFSFSSKFTAEVSPFARLLERTPHQNRDIFLHCWGNYLPSIFSVITTHLIMTLYGIKEVQL